MTSKPFSLNFSSDEDADAKIAKEASSTLSKSKSSDEDDFLNFNFKSKPKFRKIFDSDDDDEESEQTGVDYTKILRETIKSTNISSKTSVASPPPQNGVGESAAKPKTMYSNVIVDQYMKKADELVAQAPPSVPYSIPQTVIDTLLPRASVTFTNSESVVFFKKTNDPSTSTAPLRTSVIETF